MRLLLLLLLACQPDDPASTHSADPGGDSGDTGDDPDDTGVVAGCRADPGDADKARAVVLSTPYDTQGSPAQAWSVWRLDAATGALIATGHGFEMGRATQGVVSFSPDGSLGVAPQEDGTLGIFTLAGDFTPTVVEAAWAGPRGDGFYAGAVVFDPSGERAWVVDGNWEENGGGLYEVAFDCETGAPTLVGRTLASKLAVALLPREAGTAVLVAAGAAGEEGADVWMLDGWPDAPAVAGRATLFDYDDAILGSAALAGDTVLVGDTSAFSGVDNRVAAARVGAEGFEVAGKSHELLDPVAMVASPDGDAVLVSSGFGDALWVLEIADGEIGGAVRIAERATPLPGSSVGLSRGSLRGVALVTHVTQVRAVRFDGAGGADDLRMTELGHELSSIPGAIGVQP